MTHKNYTNEFSFTEYLEDPAPEPSVSKSTLHTLLTKSPLQAFNEHPRLGGLKGDMSPRADLGTAAHAALLGGDERLVVLPYDSFRSKAAREDRDAAYNEGKIPVLEQTAEQVSAMAAVAREAFSRLLGRDLDDSDREHTMIWEQQDSLDSTSWCRARPDVFTHDRQWMIDYKTASTCHPLNWSKQTIASGGYDLQHAHYLSGAGHLGFHETRFGFLVQEIEPPYACSLVTLSNEWADLAQHKRAFGMRLWSKLMAANVWPGHDGGIVEVDMPKYEAFKWDEVSQYVHNIIQRLGD